MSKDRLNKKYELFTRSPIPMNNARVLGSRNNNKNFIIKGNGSDTFELKKGFEDVYRVRKANGVVFEINRKTIYNSIVDLKQHAQTPIKLLSKDQEDKFVGVVEVINKIYSTGTLYSLIHNDIDSVFSDVKIVIPGTVAAYFIGCSVKDNFTGPIGCNPRCAASLPPGEKDLGYSTCSDCVLHYDNEIFSSLNDVVSSHAYIYIGDFSFKGFTDENIEQLHSAKIISVTLVHGKSDGTYGDMVNAVPTDKLQLKSSNLTQTDSTSDDGWGLFILIIVIIIIILLLVLLWSSLNQQ